MWEYRFLGNTYDPHNAHNVAVFNAVPVPDSAESWLVRLNELATEGWEVDLEVTLWKGGSGAERRLLLRRQVVPPAGEDQGEEPR